MATSIQVIHIEKRESIPSGLNRHITRQQFVTEGDTRKVEVWVPDNADPKKTKGNIELISRETENEDGITYEMTLQQAVDKRIREADIRPRIGQVTSLEMIFSGSHDRMAAMSRKELKNWADDTVKWAKETWGEENVVSASLHVDEKTPHIHMIVVPIVTGQSRRTSYQQNKGKSKKQYKIDHTKSRLCVNEVYTTGKLYAYHDSYAKEVSSKYGMERGVKAEPGSKKKHTNSIEYNRMLAAQAAEQQALVAELTADDFAGEGGPSKVILEANYKTPAFSGLVLDRMAMADCRYIEGRKWLMYQAVTGYSLMTGEKINLPAMEEVFKKS